VRRGRGKDGSSESDALDAELGFEVWIGDAAEIKTKRWHRHRLVQMRTRIKKPIRGPR
jgi:hypothetical protein